MSRNPQLIFRRPCVDPLPTMDEVIETCRVNGYKTNRAVFPAAGPPRFFIKYGWPGLVPGEARTQNYIYDLAQAHPSAATPRIPQVYFCFSDIGLEYSVMDYIPLPTVEHWLSMHPEEEATIRAQIVKAVAWILHLPIPNDQKLGHVGGGCPHHIFFKDWEAPFPFDDVQALEIYINTVLRHVARLHGVPKGTFHVDFSDEPICFYDGDPAKRNFLFDPESRELWRVDFEAVGVLPYSFAVLAMEQTQDAFVKGLASDLGLASDKLRVMRYAKAFIAISADPTFGIKYTPKGKHIMDAMSPCST